MAYQPNNPNGQATASNSSPVVLASDQVSTVSGDSGYSGLAVAGSRKTIQFTTSTAGAQTLLANTNVMGYSWLEVVFTSVGTGFAVTAGQFSPNTGGTYINSQSFANNNASAPNTQLGATISTIYYSAIHGNFFQIAVSALTSGTVSGFLILHATPPPYNVVASAQSGTWTFQPGNTANTTPWLVRENNPVTPTTTSVTSSATVVTLLASNTNRRQAMLFNGSTSVLYLKLGSAASTTSYTVQVGANAYYELPYPAYTGIVTGIWATANGAALVTEIV